MSHYLNPVYQKLANLLLDLLNQEFPGHGQDIDSIAKLLGAPPKDRPGHVCFGCFTLAKAAKKSPQMISSHLAETLVSEELIEKSASAGPYLNFFLKPSALAELSIKPILNGDSFKQVLIKEQGRWMIEYSQPNTHKEMHVGHMRNLCLGNALIRMSRYAGVDISAVTYPGDVGTHVAKCLWYLKSHMKEDPPIENKGAWLGKAYSLANQLLEDEKGTPKEEQNRQELTEILKELHDQKGPFYEQWKETKEWSVDLMKEAYDWADVQFDRWFWESEVDASSLEYVKELYQQNLLVKDDGAIGMDLSDEKLGFCILIKTDGTGLYSTKDVELARKKFDEFGVDRSIYIVDDRQSFHFKQVFKVLEKAGFEQAKKCHHLPYAMVELSDGAMSSRKGTIIPLMDLIHQMENKIKEEYLNKYLQDSESGWKEEDVEKTAKMIANGAIKYGMIRVDNNRKIIFNMAEWLKLDGETGPYLQYVHARIHSLIQKHNFNMQENVEWKLLKKDQEVSLLLKLMTFNDVVLSGVQKLQTMHLCSYLYELGKLFNAFYAECSIGKAETKELGHVRLALSLATGKIMKQGLDILGIQAPLKM